MAWRFPRRIPHPGQVIDAEDLNDGFLPVVEESDGRLNENCFSDYMRTQLEVAFPSTVEDDVCMRYHRVFDIGNAFPNRPDVGRMVNVPEDPAGLGGIIPAGTPGLDEIQITESWTPLTNMRHTFESYGGTLYAIFSSQLARNDPLSGVAAGNPTDFTGDTDAVFTRGAIRLDGTVFPTMVTGDQDATLEDTWVELGPTGWTTHITVELLTPIVAGQHTVDVALMATCRGRPIAADLLIHAGWKELVIVEVW